MTTELHFIDGGRRAGRGEPNIITDPSTGEEVARGSNATAEDVEDAVAAARRAFADWSTRTPGERSDAMHAWARILDARQEELASLESRLGGKPIRLATGFDIPGVIDNVAFFAGAARTLEGKASAEYSPDHTSSIRREAIGVVGSIAPWNYPLQMAAWKVLPAVAAGNTIVLKPSELTPLTSVLFAETALEAGIPAGVINIVTGTGTTVGDAIVTHPDVDMVSFTGSTAVGRQIGAKAAGAVKRVHLELGGKAPFVVFDDADVEAAARGAVAGSLINAGQDCTAATRVYAHESIFDALTTRIAALMGEVTIGRADDPATELGSLISVGHRDAVAAKVDSAREAGARVLCGGKVPDGTAEGTAFYEPTLVVDAAQDSDIVQNEVFGPVLVALPFADDDEAIRLANDTPFGLAASAWTNSVFRAQRASREIQAGCVWINDHIPIISEMPHGGYKASGFGNDMSQYSLDEYTQIKHVLMENTAAPHKEWHDLIFTVEG